MFHVELRQFPHNANRFNLDDRELHAIVAPWAREEWIEVGERKWNPHEARLTILEGPQLPLEQLSMGRGWRAAQRSGEDVTERVVGAVRDAIAADAAPAVQTPADGARAAAAGDQLALGVQLAPDVQLAALLGPGATALLAAWREVVTHTPGLAPSDALALAERRVAAPGTSAR